MPSYTLYPEAVYYHETFYHVTEGGWYGWFTFGGGGDAWPQPSSVAHLTYASEGLRSSNHNNYAYPLRMTLGNLPALASNEYISGITFYVRGARSNGSPSYAYATLLDTNGAAITQSVHFAWQIGELLHSAAVADPQTYGPAHVNGMVVSVFSDTNSNNLTSQYQNITSWIYGIYVVVTTSILPPVNTVNPVVSGSFQAGKTLSVTTGSWAYTPTSYNYLWKVDGVTVGTGSTLALQSSHVGKTLTIEVSATNAGGTSALSSAMDATGSKIFEKIRVANSMRMNL